MLLLVFLLSKYKWKVYTAPDKTLNVWFELKTALRKYKLWLMAAFRSSPYLVYFTLTIIPAPAILLNRTKHKKPPVKKKKKSLFWCISTKQASIPFHKEKRPKCYIWRIYCSGIWNQEHHNRLLTIFETISGGQKQQKLNLNNIWLVEWGVNQWTKKGGRGASSHSH